MSPSIVVPQDQPARSGLDVGLRFVVVGDPVPQGSLRRAGRYALRYDNEARLKAWRETIAVEAAKALLAQGGPIGVPYPTGSVSIALTFVVARPAKHRTSKGDLRPDAPLRPVTRPDLDKLIRSVLDALKGVAYGDDGQVTTIQAQKVYGDPRLVVNVRGTVKP